MARTARDRPVAAKPAQRPVKEVKMADAPDSFTFLPSHHELARVMEGEIEGKITELEDMWLQEGLTNAEEIRRLQHTTSILTEMAVHTKTLAKFRKDGQLLCKAYVS